jgi:hypothetical protein
MNQEEHDRRLSQVIAKCWADEGFKRKLLADPIATLNAEGLGVIPGLSIKVVENTDQIFHLVIPANQGEFSDEDLENVAGGMRKAGGDPNSAGKPFLVFRFQTVFTTKID